MSRLSGSQWHLGTSRPLDVSSRVLATDVGTCSVIKAVVGEVPPRRDLRKPDGGSADVPAYLAPILSPVDRAWSLAAGRPYRRGSITVRQGARPRLRRPRFRGHRQLRTSIPSCHLKAPGNVVGNHGTGRAYASGNYLLDLDISVKPKCGKQVLVFSPGVLKIDQPVISSSIGREHFTADGL